MKSPSTALASVLLVSGIVTAQVQSQSRPRANSADAPRIVNAEISANGRIRIKLDNGRYIQPMPEKGQSACEKVAVAGNGRLAGWLVAYSGLGASYPIPVGLIVYRVGKPITHFGNG
jgi:hypothetical protein